MKILRWFCLAVLFLFAIKSDAQTTHTNNVAWIASTTVGAQYNVYRSTVTGGPYTKINGGPVSGTLFGDTTGTGGVKYFYVITVVCGTTSTCPTGVLGESGFSPEGSGTFFGNPAALTSAPTVTSN